MAPISELPGLAPPTDANRKAARDCWNLRFVPAMAEEGHIVPLVEDLELDYIEELLPAKNNRPRIEVLLRQYTHYLLETEKKGDGKTFLLWGTYRQRLSGIHTYLQEKYRGSLILNADNPRGKWYSTLYHNLRKQVYDACWEKGQRATSSGPKKGMNVQNLERIFHKFAAKGTAAIIKLITTLLFMYFFCGRVGEMGLLTLNKAVWMDNTIFFEMLVRKQCEEKFLDIFPHYDKPVLCPFFWLATYMICSPGSFSKRDQPWLFPDLFRYYDKEDGSKSKEGVSSAVTSELKRLCATLLDDDDETYTSHMIRHGSADDMVLNNKYRDNLSVLLGAIFRGGWNFEGDCEIINYLFRRLFTSQSGKALAGYPNACMDVAMPSLDTILLASRDQTICKWNRKLSSR